MAISATKIRKKIWVQVLASPQFNNKPIGETPAFEQKEVMNRPISVSMMILTGDVKRQNVNVTFEVTEVKENKAYTQVKKYEMNPSSIRRMVRKGKDKLDISFICGTADNKIVRIKPLLITKAQTGGSKKTDLVNKTIDMFRATIIGMKFEDVLRDIITGKLQRDIKVKLNKVYPLRIFEIRSFELQKKGVAPKVVIKEEPKEEEEILEDEADQPITAKDLLEEHPKKKQEE